MASKRFAHQLLGSQPGIDARRALLDAPHMAGLVALRDRLEAVAAAHIPHFDPLDGGTRARCLLLLDAPGRRAADSGSVSVTGSGFVSRDNPDPSADNLRAALALAGMPREASVIWNAVPWYIGTANKLAPTLARNWHEAKPALRQLVALLPSLHVVVLLGRKAERAEPLLRAEFPRLLVLKCPHPGGQAYNHPHLRAKLNSELRAAATHLGN